MEDTAHYRNGIHLHKHVCRDLWLFFPPCLCLSNADVTSRRATVLPTSGTQSDLSLRINFIDLSEKAKCNPGGGTFVKLKPFGKVVNKV